MKHKLQKPLAALLALVLLTCPVLASAFPDVPDSAAYAEAAEYLNEAGIMQGDAQGNFNPDKNVTRAQMAALLCRMLDETGSEKDGSVFSDVPASYWANASIVKAAELGIIGGYSDGTFRPDNTVTYEQAVTMLVRAMNMEELAIAAGGYPNGFLNLAGELGLLEEISAEKGEILSRADVAILIYNYYIPSFLRGES